MLHSGTFFCPHGRRKRLCECPCEESNLTAHPVVVMSGRAADQEGHLFGCGSFYVSQCIIHVRLVQPLQGAVPDARGEGVQMLFAHGR